jgi:hypothetical protein
MTGPLQSFVGGLVNPSAWATPADAMDKAKAKPKDNPLMAQHPIKFQNMTFTKPPGCQKRY